MKNLKVKTRNIDKYLKFEIYIFSIKLIQCQHNVQHYIKKLIKI